MTLKLVEGHRGMNDTANFIAYDCSQGVHYLLKPRITCVHAPY